VKTPGSSPRHSLAGCRIFVAGVGTPVGDALVRVLESTGADMCGPVVPAAALCNGEATPDTVRQRVTTCRALCS
jgi:hypothetical protein